jgi:hypothetical protein
MKDNMKKLIILLFAITLLFAIKELKSQSFNGFIVDQLLPPNDTIIYTTTNARFPDLFSWSTQLSALPDPTGTTPKIEMKTYKTIDQINFVAYGNAEQTVTTSSFVFQKDTAFFDRNKRFEIVNTGSDTSRVRLFYSVKLLFK